MLLTATVVSMLALAGPEHAHAPAYRPVIGATVRAPQAHGRMYPINRTTGYQFTKNGRPWASRAIIGPDSPPAGGLCEVPGPASYGAPEWDHQRIAVVVGQQMITISPWQRIEMPGLHWLECERILWLKAHNYCSGVRTFRNDAYQAPGHDWPMHEGVLPPPPPPPVPAPGGQGGMLDDEVVTMRGTAAPTRIEPRAVIRLPDDAPRFRSKMRVMAPAIRAYQVCCDQPGVQTVRGEWSDGSVIQVLPKASAEQASTTTMTRATVETVKASKSVPPESNSQAKAAADQVTEKVAAAQ